MTMIKATPVWFAEAMKHSRHKQPVFIYYFLSATTTSTSFFSSSSNFFVDHGTSAGTFTVTRKPGISQ
uniref:Uncharacterized protein n=1 Tax=Romanomermis culicivorax TaxID=13658 RepID=A0A915JAQ1_ROMCU